MSNIYWRPEDKWAKDVGQLRLQVGEILGCYNLHGMSVFTPGAIEEIVEVAIDFSKRVRGEDDQPIRVKNRRNPRG